MINITSSQAIKLFDTAVDGAIVKGIWTPESGASFKDHCYLAATAAEIIAAKSGLNSNTAYVLGLLHDIGKTIHKEDEAHFHGLMGFEYMRNMGEFLISKICLTHTFLDYNFNNLDYSGYGDDNLEKSKELLKNIEDDDYNKLIRLSDLLVNVYRHGTLKERMIFIKNKYHVDKATLRKKYKKAMYLKAYFDTKCGCDVYSLLGLK